MSKYLFQEDDALINGRDPDYRGIYGWWEERFPGRRFWDDWKVAEDTEEDHQDAFIRTLIAEGVEYRVQSSFDGYAVEKPQEDSVLIEPKPPSTPTTYITVEFLRDSGLLQEMNRQFLHPLGLAAEVVVEGDPKRMAVIHIQDWTADVEGVIFAEGVMDKEKAKIFGEFRLSRHMARLKAIGYIIQSVGKPEAH